MGVKQKLVGVALAAAVGAIGVTAVDIATPSIAKHEGRRLQAYADPIGIWTICEGWTHGVKRGDRATPEECDQYTQQGLMDAWEIFSRWVPADVIADLPPRTVAAFLTFIYNVGPGGKGVKDGFVWLKSGRHSTMLIRLQAGDARGACMQLPSWTKADGKQLPGLVNRRRDELSECLQDLPR